MSRLAELRGWLLPWLLVGAAVPAAPAQDDDAGQTMHVVVTSGGVRRYGAGRWGVADLAVANQGSQEAEALVSAFFVDWTGRVTSGQFARQVWVPAEARRQTWLPFQAPEQLPLLINGVWRLESRAVVLGSGESELLRDSASQALRSRTLLAPMGFPHPTGVITPEDNDDIAAVMNVVAEARRSVEIDEAVVMLHQRRLPSLPQWLDSLDVVVLAGDERLADDYGGLQSLRRWVRGGGQLWVMRDRVSAETMDILFGDDLPLLAVGRESLPSVVVGPGRWQEFGHHEVKLDPPAQLVQILEHDGVTLAEVDGWPAAVRRRLGDGAVLVTMLSAKGWLDDQGRYTKALGRIGTELYDMSLSDPWPSEVARAQLQARIGHGVPPKWLVLSALLAYCLALLGIGLALARRRRLERLLWAAPALAALTTAALTTIGFAYRQAPLTVGRLQLVRAAGGSGEAEVRSEATVYSPTQLDERLSGAGSAQRPMSRAVRMVWTDEGQWRREGRPLRPGARTFSTRSTIEPFQVQATARLTEEGLVGQLHGDDVSLEQAIIAAPRSASLAVRWRQQRRFTAGQQDVLSRGVHVPAQLLSEENRRRQELLQAWLDEGGADVLPGPTLLGWTELHNDGFHWPQEARHLGSSLVAVPLALLKSRPGAAVAIPSSLLPVRTRSTIYDSRRGRWSQVQLSTAHAILQFELPRQVLPLQVTHAELIMKLDAPNRPVLISYNGRLQHQLDGPEGVRPPLILDVGQLPQPVRDGVIELTLQVERPADDSKALPWSLDYIQLSVHGVVSTAAKGGDSSE